VTRFDVVPIHFDPSGNPMDRNLYDAAQAFCKREFGKEVNFRGNVKTWARVKISDEGDGYEVVGMVALGQVIDCHMFHVKPGGEDEDSRKEARQTRDALMARAAGFIQDYAGTGTDVLVYVSEEQRPWWAGFLRMIRARPANRFIVKV